MKSKPHDRLIRRHRRVRAKIFGTATRPRLSVSRSLQHIEAQIINDEKGMTIVSASDRLFKKKGTKQERALYVGQEIARRAKEKGITSVVFDRGGNRYHGRVRALAESARKEGITF